MSNLFGATIRHRIFLLAVATLLSSPAHAAASNPVLVELFTSEGCSSCPPAESLLRALDSAQPVSGEQLIVLEEHVDYWDDQGWKDPWSSHALTLRQSDYVDHLRLKEGPYTPQMVVDGTEAFVGSDRTKAAVAFKKAVADPKINIELSSVRPENGKLLAHLTTAEMPAKAEAFVALALDHTESQVLRGENGGKHLEHVAVVKHLVSVGKVKKGESFSKDVALELDRNEHDQAYRLIAFVQEAGEGKILGVTMVHFKPGAENNPTQNPPGSVQ